MLPFTDRIALSDGSVIFYHEAILADGGPFHLVALVGGGAVPAYLEFIRNARHFTLRELGQRAKVLAAGKGSLSREQLRQALQENGFA